MKNFFTTKRICRAAVIAALYMVLTYAFAPFAFGTAGFFQIRPAEALCILPLFFPEAISALWIGCMLSNLISALGVWDIVLGGGATLIAAFGTYFIGKLFKNDWLKIILGGIFPILCNAFIVPLIIVFIGQYFEYGYWFWFCSLLVTESIWIYALGIPFYFSLQRLRKKGVRVLLDSSNSI